MIHIKLPPRPNASNALHFGLFFGSAIIIQWIPQWLYLSILVFLIELQQAIIIADPWYAWFTSEEYGWDTWYDMIAGWVAIALVIFVRSML